MHNRAYALITGAFLVVLMSAALLMGYWLTGADSDRRPYVIVTDGSVSGLSEGAQIHFRGVRAGRVERVRIDPEDPRNILIHIAVSADIPMLQSTYATLRQSALTGLTQIELADTGEQLPPLVTRDDEPARIPMRPGLLDQLTASGYEIVENLNELTERVNELLDEGNRERLVAIVARVDDTLEAAASLIRTMELELAQSTVAIRQSMRSVDTLTDGAAGTLQRVDGLLQELGEVAQTARLLGHDVYAQTVPELNSALERLESAGEELGRLARGLRQQPDSLLRGRPRPAPGPGEE